MGIRNYIAICYQAGKLGLPLTFQTDLTRHDQEACKRNPDTRRFIWAVGTSGTNMVWLDPCESLLNASKARDLINTFLQYDRSSIHYWDGTNLATIDADKAVEILTALCK